MNVPNRWILAIVMMLWTATVGCQRGEVPAITPVPVNTPEPVVTDEAPEVQQGGQSAPIGADPQRRS